MGLIKLVYIQNVSFVRCMNLCAVHLFVNYYHSKNVLVCVVNLAYICTTFLYNQINAVPKPT